MLLESVAYTRPGSVDEALAELAANEGAALLAGGQSLLNVLKNRVASVEALLDISRCWNCGGSTSGGRLARDRRVRHLRRARPLARCPRRPHGPRRCRRPHRGPPDPQPRDDRRQLLPRRSDQQPAADPDRTRCDDEHPGALGHPRGGSGELLPCVLLDRGRAGRAAALGQHPGGRRRCGRLATCRSRSAATEGDRPLGGVGARQRHDRGRARGARRGGTVPDSPRPEWRSGCAGRPSRRRRSARRPRRSATTSSPSAWPRSGDYRRAMARVVARRAVAEAIERGAA